MITNEGSNQPVFTSSTQSTRTFTSRKCSNASRITVTKNILRSSRAVSTISLDFVLTLNVTTWESMQCIWMTQWLMIQNYVAFNATLKKVPEKQATFRSASGKDQQLDHVLLEQRKQKILYRRRGKRHDSLGKLPQTSYCAFPICMR